MGPQELAGPETRTSESAPCDTTIPACMNNAAAHPVCDINAASRTSAIQSKAQYRTITGVYGRTRTVVVNLDEIRQATQIRFPTTSQIEQATVERVLDSWSSLQDLDGSSLFDNAGHDMG